jgi:hypothetical protein
MKKTVTIFALILLLLCMPSMALNVQLVQADVKGVGKFLTIEIVGEGYVTATKVASCETWDYYWADPPMTEKVGAGTVELEAFASNGWEFFAWEGDLTGISENPMNYKAVKYGYVIAVFIHKTFTITASAVGNGTIDPDGDVVVEYGASQTFEFIPDIDNHVSAIAVDGIYLSSFTESYTFYDVTADHTIEVLFSADETANVPAGTGVTVFMAPSVSLTFDDTDGGTATGEEKYYPVGGAIAWEILVTFTFIGEVKVTLQYNDTGLSLIDEQNLCLIRGDSIEALRSDVNNDLIVDGQDVSNVANAVKQSDWYNPLLDVNNDGFVDEADIYIVNINKGTILEDITDGIDTNLNIIWGTTDQFSIFGVHH